MKYPHPHPILAIHPILSATWIKNFKIKLFFSREKELAKQRAERERYLKEKQKAQEAALERIRKMVNSGLLYTV